MLQFLMLLRLMLLRQISVPQQVSYPISTSAPPIFSDDVDQWKRRRKVAENPHVNDAAPTVRRQYDAGEQRTQSGAQGPAAVDDRRHGGQRLQRRLR